MNNTCLTFFFTGFLCACSPPQESETTVAAHPMPYEYAAQLDTVELGVERLYVLRYTLVGGETDMMVTYRIQLVAGSLVTVDSVLEFVAAGDSLHGEYVFVDMPVSHGAAAFSASVQPLIADGQ